MEKNKLKWFLLLLTGLCIFFFSCEKENNLENEPDSTQKPVSGDTLKVNTFIYEDVQTYYLWTSTVNWRQMHPEYEPDPFGFFDKLMYRSVDEWSELYDNAQDTNERFEGTFTTFGYELSWWRFSNSPSLFAVVLLVYPDSPAEKAGLKRGDFLMTINGLDITVDNYMDFYYAPSISVGKGILTDTSLAVDTVISMTAEKMYEEPVYMDTVIVKGTHKIGYLCYTGYTQESKERLLDVFAGFKSQGVSDVVLDLRYNGGGYADVSRWLSSILAPHSAVQRKDVFLTRTWNEQMMPEAAKIGYVTENFIDTLSVNMDLTRLFVLTTYRTASASEATIIGLKPYMNVIQIGEQTHGKYYGGLLLEPLVYDRRTNDWVLDQEIENWLMYLMVYRYADKNGDVSFSGGLVPDMYAEEEDFSLAPIGDEQDPLLGKAIEMITGAPVRTRVAQRISLPNTIKAAELRSPLNGKMIHTGELPVKTGKE